MVDLHELVSHLDEYLEADTLKDYAPIGLQVEGVRGVNRIVAGVSACMELFREAVARRADAVLVHHGMFWDSDPRVVRGSLKERLKFLLDHDLSLVAYHLPLDRHPEVGNNIQIVRRLGLSDPRPFGEYKGKTIGYLATVAAPATIASFMRTVRDVVNPDLRHHAFGPGEIRQVAVCSGGAPELVREAVEKNADVYLTGEESEWVYHLAKEEGIHYVAAGHHATERFGPMALGEYLAEKFAIDVEFVDVPNPI